MTISTTGIITNKTQLQSLQSALQGVTEVAFDTETNGLEHDRHMIGYSIAFKSAERYEGFYVPVRHEAGDDLFAVAPDNAPLSAALDVLDDVFKRDNMTVWIHNAKFDLKVLRNEGLAIDAFKAEVLDTQCISWVMNPDRQGGHGLKSLVKTILGYEMGSFAQFAGYKRNCEVPVGLMGKYAIADAVWLLRLAHELYPQLTPAQLKVLKELEMPVMRIIEEMEHYGFKVDTQRLKEAGRSMSIEAKEIETQFLERFGMNAKIGSAKWLSDNLCGSMWGTFKLPQSNGCYSVNRENLEAWSEGSIVGTTQEGRYWAERVMRHRKLAKLVSTYTDSLLREADEKGRVHGGFNQWGTATGRMSSSKPNMQNIPSSRSPEGDFLRKSFVAEDGFSLIVADYSQIELRMTAHLSQDPVMLNIYRNNGDIHQMTADACECARFDAKAINFGLIYKMGAKTLGKAINKHPDEAQRYIDKYFENYHGVAVWQADTIAKARQKGYTWTVTARRRYLPFINSSDNSKRAENERAAINTMVQGSAADLIKIAMRNFYRKLAQMNIGSDACRFVGQVHDELIVEVRSDLAEQVSSALQQAMESAAPLSVPLIAEPCIAKSWGEAK